MDKYTKKMAESIDKMRESIQNGTYDMLLQQMREAYHSGATQELTVEKAIQLKGKRIRTIYFGYKGQDGVDEFVVGDIVEKNWPIKEEPKIKELLYEDGSESFIRNHFMFGHDYFTCSDSDRKVYFIEILQ